QNGKPIALKWYFQASATTEQRKALETLIKMGPPSDRFLWPIEIATSSSTSGFGYIMPLRDPRFRGIVDMMKRRIEPGFRALATADWSFLTATCNFIQKAFVIAPSRLAMLFSILRRGRF